MGKKSQRLKNPPHPKKPGPPGSKPSLFAEHPFPVIGLVLAACLVPFINQAVQTDDALFVWTGQWIQKHPGDFFGFDVDWWYSTIPMWVANCNPPLLSYLFAGVASLFGGSEAVLHATCFVISYAAAAGIYSLARMWCQRPLLATFIAIFTPAFLVSSATLMCDVMALAFWVWSMVFWEEALAKNRSGWRFLAAGVLAGLAILTKYSAVDLLPLLAFLAIVRTRKPGLWLAGLILPLLMLAGYELLTRKLYGHGLFMMAVHYAKSVHIGSPGGWKASMVIGLAFAGGSWLSSFFFAPLLWPRRIFWIGGAILYGGLLLGLRLWNPDLTVAGPPDLMQHWGFAIQTALFIAAGLNVLLLLIAALRQRADAATLALVFWVAGVCFFATVLNWTVNVRSFLPAVPAVAILVVRRLESRQTDFMPGWRMSWPLVPAGIVAFGLVISACQLANLERTAAEVMVQKYQSPNQQLWFEGHGAFQYYMEQRGGKPLDFETSLLQRGDTVVLPQLGGFVVLPAGSVGWRGYFKNSETPWIDLSGGTSDGTAGFFGATFGPVPFAIVKQFSAAYYIVKVINPIQYNSQPDNPGAVAAGAVPGFSHITSSADGLQPSFSGNMDSLGALQKGCQLEARGNFGEAIQQYRNAVDLDPTNAIALNNLAWLLATSSKPELQNGKEAVMLAGKAAELTNYRYPMVMNTLAAAHAEVGDFQDAVRASFCARSLAEVTGQNALANESEKFMALYSSGRKYQAP